MQHHQRPISNPSATLPLMASCPFLSSLPDPIGTAKRERSNGRCRANSAARDERAAVHNKQIGNVMRLMPGIHDRVLRVGSHAHSPHEVTRPRVRFALLDIGCTCGLEQFPSGLNAAPHHSAGIFRKRVKDARDRNTIRVLHRGVKLNPVPLFWKVLSNDTDVDDVRESTAHLSVMIDTPRNIRFQSRCERAAPAPYKESVATNEIVPRIRLIELLAVQRCIARMQIVVDAVGRNAAQSLSNVKHESFSYQPRGIPQPIWEQLRFRIQQYSWGSDPIGAKNYHSSELLTEVSLRVIINSTARAPPVVHTDLANAG